MRTTFNSTYRESAAGLDAAAERLVELQRQVSTGRRLARPSDDPTGAASAVGEHAELASIEQYSRATTSVGSRLTVIDTVLSEIVSALTAASTAAMSARGSEQSPAQREAAAQRLESLRDVIFENFNASYQGTYLFGGANATSPPFVKEANGTILPYAGSDSEVQVDIDRSRAVRVALNGDAIARGGAAQDVFAVLDGLIAAARSGDNAALGDGMARLDAAFGRAAAAQSRVGADMGAIDEQKLRLAQTKIAATARLEKVEAANLAEAITGMHQAQTAYQAALGAASSVTRVSLMDYLR